MSRTEQALVGASAAIEALRPFQNTGAPADLDSLVRNAIGNPGGEGTQMTFGYEALYASVSAQIGSLIRTLDNERQQAAEKLASLTGQHSEAIQAALREVDRLTKELADAKREAERTALAILDGDGNAPEFLKRIEALEAVSHKPVPCISVDEYDSDVIRLSAAIGECKIELIRFRRRVAELERPKPRRTVKRSLTVTRKPKR